MIAGKVKLGNKTKELVKRLKPGEIAIIDHKDLDQIASQSLVEKKVKAVLNINSSISGKYPNQGPSLLLKKGIILIDHCDKKLFSLLNDGDQIEIEDGIIFKDGLIICKGEKFSLDKVDQKLQKARDNIERELEKFIDNTLAYARKEKKIILETPIPDLNIDLKGKHALIVVRGADYKEDLEAVKSYIRELKPVIIAVDGGADACLDRGYTADIIIGDMDSVSDKALKSSGLIVVHAYPDGRAPGLKRIKKLGLEAEIFPAYGTSEDIAMLLAYNKGADLITAVGTHSNMIDFLEKGRPGMGSTLLVRMMIGNKLVDAKGLSKLYQNRIHYHYWAQILLAILLPLSILGFFSPPWKQIFQLLVLKIKLIFPF